MKKRCAGCSHNRGYHMNDEDCVLCELLRIFDTTREHCPKYTKPQPWWRNR